MGSELRDYQATAVTEIRSAVALGDRRLMVQMPTGAGKTKLAGALIEGSRRKQKRLVFTVPAISLIDQTVEAFYADDIRDIGVIQADHEKTDETQPIQVASVQTLAKRGVPDCDVVMVDEAHRLYQVIVEWMKRAQMSAIPFIGLSATPWTKGLGKLYQRLIVGTTTQELIDKGWLVPFNVFAPSHPDLRGVRLVAGDYHEGDLSNVMIKDGLVADIVSTWKEKAEQRPTICFAVDRAHAAKLCERFEQAGVGAAYMDCNTPLTVRQEIRRKFKTGAVKVVCNVDVIGIGVDWPEIACISYCRPTKSEIRFVQNIGRGLRTSDGKSDLLILDHSDTHLRLGFVTEIAFDGLHEGKEKPARKSDSVRLPKECKSCGYLQPHGSLKCPNCGSEAARTAPILEYSEAELQKFNGKHKHRRAEVEIFTPADKAIFFAELKTHGLMHGYKPGWASMKYKEMFGRWPERSIEHVAPAAEISRATARWIKSRQIAWAHSRQNKPSLRADIEAAMAASAPVEPAGQLFDEAVPPWEPSRVIPDTLMTERDVDDFISSRSSRWR